MLYILTGMMGVIRRLVWLLLLLLPFLSSAKPVFSVDTMTYSVNLDIPENAHLKNLPVLILKNYFLGHFRAYYPKREMNEILPDDLLAHYGKTNFQADPQFCWSDYASHSYLQEFYDKFKKELRYREVIYYNAGHTVVKREIAWIQLVYTDTNYYGGQMSYPGPKFWMFELYQDPELRVPNIFNPSMTLSLRQEFDARHFVPNEIGRENIPDKSNKFDNAEEH